MSTVARQAKAPADHAPHGLRESPDLVRLPEILPGLHLFVAEEANHRASRQGRFERRAWKVAGGTQGAGTGELDDPSGVHYCARCKRLFIADTMNNRIVRCKPDGSEWEILESPGFDRCYDVHHDHDSGYLYVAEYPRICRTNWAGTDITWYGNLISGNGEGQFEGIFALDFDPATGYIYCADALNHRIVRTKIDGSGWVQICKEDGAGLPIPGFGNYEFEEPSGIWYDAENAFLYVSDPGVTNDRISRFTIGKTGWQELAGAGGDSFQEPWGIFYHSGTGFVFVADKGNHRLIKTKMDGTGWQAFGGPGAGQYQYSSPKGIYYER